MSNIIHVPTIQELWRIDLAILEHFFDAHRELDKDTDQMYLNIPLYQFDEHSRRYYLLAEEDTTAIYFYLAEKFKHQYPIRDVPPFCISWSATEFLCQHLNAQQWELTLSVDSVRTIATWSKGFQQYNAVIPSLPLAAAVSALQIVNIQVKLSRQFL